MAHPLSKAALREPLSWRKHRLLIMGLAVTMGCCVAQLPLNYYGAAEVWKFAAFIPFLVWQVGVLVHVKRRYGVDLKSSK